MSSVNAKVFRFILTVFLFVNVNAFNIPSYHKPCKFSDPKFEQCAVSVANTIMANFEKGDTTFIDAKLKDIRLPVLELADKFGDYINISDVHVVGFENLSILKVKKVSGKNRLETVAFVKDIKVSGDYSIDAIVDGTHVVGKGKGSVTFSGAHYKCNFEWKLIDKNGDKYVEVTKFEVIMDVDKVIHEIDGVDDNFLNENWAELFAKILPTTIPFIEETFHDFTDTMFNEIPYNKFFLD